MLWTGNWVNSRYFIAFYTLIRSYRGWASFMFFTNIVCWHTVSIFSTFSVCVCVCACACVRACVCVRACAYVGSFRLQDVWDILEDQRCYVVSIISRVSAKFVHIHFWKCQYFTSIRQKSSTLTNWRDMIWYILLAKRWHMLM